MRNLKSFLFSTVLLLCIPGAHAQVSLTNSSAKANEFELVGPNNGHTAKICYDKKDAVVVKKAADLFSADIQSVTNKKIEAGASIDKLQENSIIIGTLGQNEWINKFVQEGKLDIKGLEGKWESYLITIVQNPAPGVKKVLVIAGSDRRGTAYGVFSISEAIGVSPWYWWADVPVEKKSGLCLKVDRFISREPSVKYRGLFINDEDWGLLRWAKKTFDTKRGNIGPKTYAKVCELILRLKGNYLCPAMHEASTAFNKIPENKLVADSFAIVMGSVHCEPLLFNNASEWDKKTMGEWDYINNKENINKVLKQRVTENSPFENVYTLALRGMHDRAMTGSNDMKERVKMLGSALNDQRQILVDVIQKPADKIPQAFTPYKEVLDVYTNGLSLPEDVTIIWPDDNYGYMKQLSNPKEQKRSGRSGVYYHASYLGKPHDYLWISSTPPALMYEELRKAYDTTADRLWLLNVGDIKSCEFSLDLFLSMAYDIDAFNFENIATYQARWLSKMFGNQYYNDFLDISNTYFNLAFSRKPEFMGWGYQWNTNKFGRERNTDTDFSFPNYREAENRLAAYNRIGSETESIMSKMNDSQKASLYQLLYYPVKGAGLMNKMILTGQKNRWYAQQGRAATNDLKAQVKIYYDSLQIITDGYNALLHGKWNQLMTTKQGFAAAYFELPKLDSVTLNRPASLGVLAENEDILKGQRSFHALPAFNAYLRKSYYFDVFNKGAETLKWSLKISDKWIIVDKPSGKARTEERIQVRIDWNSVPKGENIFGTIEISANKKKETVFVSVFNPASPSPEEMNGLFVEDNGCISINAADFHRKKENNDIKIKLIHNLGFENISVQLGNPTAPAQQPGSSIVPRVDYDFYTFDHGSVDVYTYTLPAFPLYSDRDYAGHEASNIETRYGVCIDEGPVMTPTYSSFEYAQAWNENVLKNCSVKKSTLHIDKPGKHTVSVLCGDAGVVVQKIVLDFGGMKRSYLGPQITKSMIFNK